MPKKSQVLKNKNFLLLCIGQVISQLGDRLGQMALIGFAYSRAPGSAVEIAKILAFTIVPVFLIGPIAGVYVDRWDRRKTMYACDFIRTALVFVIPFFLFYARNLVLLYTIIFVVYCIGRFFILAKLSIVPQLVNKDDLLLANSLVNISGIIAAVVGYGIGGIVVDLLGPKNAFYMDAISFLVSAVTIYFIGARTTNAIKADSIRRVAEVGKEIVNKIRKSVWREIKDGIIYFIKHKDIRFTASIMFILSAAAGSVCVVMIVFIQNTLHSPTRDLGLLIMFLAMGLFFGSLVYGKFGAKLSEYKAIFSSLILSGIIIVVFARLLSTYPLFYMAVFLSFLFGVFISPILSASVTLIHNISENDMMGKVFNSLEMVIHLGFLLFMFISSFLSNIIAKESILIAVGVIFSAVGIANIIYYRKMPWISGRSG